MASDNERNSPEARADCVLLDRYAAK